MVDDQVKKKSKKNNFPSEIVAGVDRSEVHNCVASLSWVNMSE